MKTARTTAILILSFVLTTTALAASAEADTVYFNGGFGRAYKNNYISSGCHDQYGSTSDCYQGTWADTVMNPCACHESMSVAETPFWWEANLFHDGPFSWHQKNDITDQEDDYAATNGANYDAIHDHYSTGYHHDWGTGGYGYTSN